MNIGVGITTRNRTQCLELSIEQIKKHWPKDMLLNVVVVDDNSATIYQHDETKNIYNLQRLGIAKSKNICIKELSHCDYIFLIDDDVVVIKDGWVDFFIDAHKRTGNHHFLYMKDMKDPMRTMKINEASGIEIFNNCNGCFMFLTKEVIEKVGGFNKNYEYYGFEHAGYTDRIHKAGLTPYGKYLCVKGTGDYIYAMDLDFHLPFNKQVNFNKLKSQDKRSSYVMNNLKIYHEDIKTIYQPIN